MCSSYPCVASQFLPRENGRHPKNDAPVSLRLGWGSRRTRLDKRGASGGPLPRRVVTVFRVRRKSCQVFSAVERIRAHALSRGRLVGLRHGVTKERMDAASTRIVGVLTTKKDELKRSNALCTRTTKCRCHSTASDCRTLCEISSTPRRSLTDDRRPDTWDNRESFAKWFDARRSRFTCRAVGMADACTRRRRE